MGIVHVVGEAGRESPGPAGLTIGGIDIGRRSRSRIRAHGPPLREGAAFVSPGRYLDRWRVVSARPGFGSASASLSCGSAGRQRWRAAVRTQRTQHKRAMLAGVAVPSGILMGYGDGLSASLILAQEQRWRRA